MHHPTHMQQLMARALADQAEEAALEYATTWQAVTAGALTAAAALSADIEEEEEEKEQRDWLDRLRELMGLPSRR